MSYDDADAIAAERIVRLRAAQRRQKRAKFAREATNPLFTPASLSVVSSWFRLSQGTITGSGYSAIPDALDAGNPATQATDARRPPGATSANGLPILNCTTGYMPTAITAARSHATTWGYWAWLRQSATSDSPMTMAVGVAGADINRHFLWFNSSGTRLNFRAFVNNTDARHAEIAGLTAGTWRFLTVEYNGARTGDARCTITLNGVVQTLSFGAVNGVSEMPATLRAVTGNVTLFSAFGAAGPYFVGNVGPNFGFFNAAMPGATEGLLTPQARALLMNYQAPT